MSSSFDLILDTTGPQIEVKSPSYSSPNVKTQFTITANEDLAEYQDFYTVDSKGKERSVTFSFNGDSFKGIIDFTGYSPGITTLYAQVKDEVFNLSNEVAAPIHLVTESSQIEVSVSSTIRDIYMNSSSRIIEKETILRSIAFDNKRRNVSKDETVREIEVTDLDG